MTRPATEQNSPGTKSAGLAPPSERTPLLLRPAVQIGLLLLWGFVLYFNTLHAPFIFDDNLSIVANPAIRNLDYFFNFELVRTLNLPPDFQNSFALRPVVYLTFYVNYLLGGAHEFGFHLFNTAIHLGNAVLVYLLVRVTLRLAPLAPERSEIPPRESLLPLFVALIFVSHPLQTQAVTYITQRFTSMVAFFYFAGLLLYILAQMEERLMQRRLYYGVALLVTILAMKCKETAFTLPFMLMLYDLFFLSGTPRQRCYRLLPFFLTMAIIPVTLIGLTQAPTSLSEQAVSESMNLVNFAGVSRWDYLQTQFGVIVTYLRLLILPVGQNFDPDYRLAQGFLEWRVAGALLLLLALFGYAILLAFRFFCANERSGERIIAFGIFWFFITLSVESSIIPIDDLMFEYRVYLPSFGIFLALATAVGMAIQRGTLPRRGTVGIALIVVTILAAATIARNRLYRDNITLLEDVVAKSPDKARAHSLLGVAYLLDNRLDAATREFVKVLLLRPDDANTMLNLGNIYFNKGEFTAAIDQYQRSMQLLPGNPLAHSNLGMCYLNIGKMIEAEQELQTALSINPSFRDARSSLAHLYEILGRNAEAIVQYRKQLEFFPRDQDALERLQDLSRRKDPALPMK